MNEASMTENGKSKSDSRKNVSLQRIEEQDKGRRPVCGRGQRSKGALRVPGGWSVIPTYFTLCRSLWDPLHAAETVFFQAGTPATAKTKCLHLDTVNTVTRIRGKTSKEGERFGDRFSSWLAFTASPRPEHHYTRWSVCRCTDKWPRRILVILRDTAYCVQQRKGRARCVRRLVPNYYWWDGGDSWMGAGRQTRREKA